LWFKPSISFHNLQLYHYVSSYNFVTSHSHIPVSNNRYTERHIGSSHYVRGCHQISTVMLLFAEILNHNAQYSLSLTTRHQFANRGTGTPNSHVTNISYSVQHKWKKPEKQLSQLY
jgi:hypothetical protein